MKVRSVLTACWAALSCSLALAQASYEVHFRQGKAFLPENRAAFVASPNVESAEIIDGHFVRLVQFYAVPTADQRARMASEGLVLTDYLSFGAYVAVFPQNFDAQKLDGFNVRSVVPLEAKRKIAPSLLERPFGKWARRAGGRIEAIAQPFEHISIDRAAALFRAEGIEVISKGRMNGILHIELAEDQIEKTAGLPFVKWLELVPPPSSPDDTHGRALHRSNLINSDVAGGLKYDGKGVNVLVRDDGTVGPHIDFEGRLINIALQQGGIEHGDGVAGIFAGAGNLDPVNKGMASGATIYAVDYQADFQDTTVGLILYDDIKVSNTSYSDGCNTGYTTGAQTVDRQIFENPTVMHCFSAGNNGTADCDYGAGTGWGNITGGHKQSKNSIATANLQFDLDLEPSSSRGPAFDGRLKPDLAAHGANQVSCDPNNAYQIFGGTSAASPGTAGVFAQLFGAHKTLKGQEPEAALIKAAMMATASDLGNPGPDFLFGWGHLNAYRALKAIEENRFESASLDQGGSFSKTIDLPNGARQFRFMIYWAEKEATELTDKALLNNLDLTGLNGSAPLFPLVLNAEPVVASLSAAALPGIDALNNVEEIVVNDVAPGASLSFTVKGTEVPFGPQKFWMVWEIIGADELAIAYPAGGEGFVPGEQETVYWDALPGSQGFSLAFSSDDGQNWQAVGSTIGAARRAATFNVPNVVTSKGRFKLKRGSKEVVSKAFSIIGQPDSVSVLKICPDSMTVFWPSVAGASRYDVFRLGQTSMDSVGTSADTSLTFAISTPLKKYWIAVRAAGLDGLRGRRTIAKELGGSLMSCPQPYDLQLVSLTSPVSNDLTLCDPEMIPVSVKIANIGIESAFQIPIKYRFGNGPVHEETLFANDTLAPGETFDFTFGQPLDISTDIEAPFAVWLDLPSETARYNDSIAFLFKAVISNGKAVGIEQDFEGADFPPAGWGVLNAEGDLTWARSGIVTGRLEPATRAAFMDFFDYQDSTRLDRLISWPFDLQSAATPSLIFDYAYAPYSSPGYHDGLIVEVRADCGKSAPVRIFEKYENELATASSTGSAFVPTAADEWKQAFLPLDAFKGQRIVVDFIARNGYGNNLYLDNIGITEELLAAPQAIYSASSDTICRGDSVVFAQNSTGGQLLYSWKFGGGSSPSASTEPGPHTVSYISAGTKFTSLKVTNGLGESTASKSILVKQTPLANFNFSVDQNTATFTNSSTSSSSWLWDFGDGTTSTDKTPVHAYAAVGVYVVVLTASSDCGSNAKTKTVTISVVKTHDPTAESFGARLAPNPSDGRFLLSLQKPLIGEAVEIKILDARGAVAHRAVLPVDPASTAYSIDRNGLPKGVYQVVFQTEKMPPATLKLVVQ